MRTTDPSHCSRCEQLFLNDSLLQAEMRYLALTSGAGASTAEFNERMNEEHIEHMVRSRR